MGLCEKRNYILRCLYKNDMDCGNNIDISYDTFIILKQIGHILINKKRPDECSLLIDNGTKKMIREFINNKGHNITKHDISIIIQRAIDIHMYIG